MKLTVNGDSKQLNREQITVSETLRVFEVKSPDMVSVQLNREFLDRDLFEKTILKDGDELEFLYFMGGGSL